MGPKGGPIETRTRRMYACSGTNLGPRLDRDERSTSFSGDIT